MQTEQKWTSLLQIKLKQFVAHILQNLNSTNGQNKVNSFPMGKPSIWFSSISRKPLGVVIDRGELMEKEWKYQNLPDSLCFQTNCKIIFHGIGVLCGIVSHAKVYLMKDSNVIGYSKREEFHSRKGAKLMFKEPVLISPNTTYRINLWQGGDNSFLSVYDGKDEVTKDGVKVTFSEVPDIGTTNGTNTNGGQIPRLYFTLFEKP